MLDFDEIRKEVAIKHKVLLTEDDPILVSVTLNDLVLRRYVEVLTAQNEGHLVALSTALESNIQQSKEVGGKIITDAADFISSQVRDSVKLAASEVAATIRQELADAKAQNSEAEKRAATASTSKGSAVISACVAGFCAVVALGSMIVVLTT